MKSIRKALDGFENVLAVVAGLSVFSMMIITAFDVFMRYGFKRPLSWAFDLVTQYLLVAAFFFSFSIALRLGEHVAVDFFVQRFPAKIRRIAMSVALACCAVLVAIIAVTAALEATLAFRAGEVVAGVIPWPIWVQKSILAVGLAPMALRLTLLSLGVVSSTLPSEST